MGKLLLSARELGAKAGAAGEAGPVLGAEGANDLIQAHDGRRSGVPLPHRRIVHTDDAGADFT